MEETKVKVVLKKRKRTLAFMLTMVLIVTSTKWTDIRVWATEENIEETVTQIEEENETDTLTESNLTNGRSSSTSGGEAVAIENDVITTSYEVTWNDNTESEYSGTEITPKSLVSSVTKTVTIDGVEGISESVTDYTVSVSKDSVAVENIKYAGEYTVSVTINNVENAEVGSGTNTYTVTKKEIAIVWGDSSFTYTGSSQFPTVTVEGTAIASIDEEATFGVNGELTVTLSVEDSSNEPTEAKNAGVYTARLTIDGEYETNYSISGLLEQSYTINQKDLSDKCSITINTESGTYTGSAITPSVTEVIVDGETWESEISINESKTDGLTYYLKNTDINTITGQMRTEAFYIDNELPILEVTINKVDGIDITDTWTQSKSITVTATEDNLQKVYYTVGEDTTQTTVTMSGNTGSVEIPIDMDETGKIYTFYAVDNAGNVSTLDDDDSVTIKKIDAIAPTISVTSGEKTITSGDSSFINVAITFTISVTDGEISSGELTYSVYKNETLDDDAMTTDWDKNITFTPIAVNIAEKATYTVEVRDAAGNVSDAFIFDVVYDPIAPEINSIMVTDGTGAEISEDAWLNLADFNGSEDPPAITFNVTDPGEDTELVSGIASVTLQRGDGDAEQLTVSDEGIYNETIPKSDFNGTYTITATDKAGNVYSQTRTVKVDITNPTITDVTVNGTNNGKENPWYNNEAVSFTVTGDCSIVGVFATTEEITDSEYIASEIIDKNHYIGSDTVMDEDENKVFILDIFDTDFNTREYYFYAYDEAGNILQYETTQSIRKDSQVPLTENVLISFTNTTDTDSVSAAAMNGNVFNKISSVVTNIFVKETVEVKIYVPDAVATDNSTGATETSVFSGVGKVTITYNGTTYTCDLPEIGENAYIIEDGTEITTENEVAYDIFTFDLVLTGDMTEITDKLTITSVTDVAGNTCAGGTVSIEGGNLIVIDKVAPELASVNYGDNKSVVSLTGKDYYFYNAEANVVLNILEKNFFAKLDNTDDSDVVPVPSFTLSKESAAPTISDLTWVDAGNNVTTATATFPVSADYEYEYSFSLSYADPSGNQMISTQSGNSNVYNVSAGKYSSDVVVMDTIAPILTGFDIVAGNGGSIVLDDNLYYAKNIDGDDIQLQFTIDDNPKYFNEVGITVEYATITDGTTGVWTTLALPSGSSWANTEDRIHTATYTFDGMVDAENTYVFRISYADYAGNQMELSTGSDVDITVEEGVQVSGTALEATSQIVIDHKMPELGTLTFTEPTSIYDGDSALNANGTLKTAISSGSSRLYYNKDISADIRIADGYLDAESIAVTLYSRSDRESTWAEVAASDYTFTNTNGSCLLAISNNDLEYYFIISYTDRSGNTMVYGSAPSVTTVGEMYTGGIENGIYTAPIIVKDVTVPVQTVTYSVDNKNFFALEDFTTDNSVNKVYIQSTIVEKNFDLENTTVTVTAVDVNGSTENISQVEANQYTKTLLELIEAGVATIDVEKAVIQLEFVNEAVYTVSIDVQDKVEYDVKHNEAKKSFSIDRTAPVITLAYTGNGIELDSANSDITYEVVNGGTFANIINKLTFGYFSKEAIRVSVTAHDSVSGIQSITYSYTSMDDNSGSSISETVPVTLSHEDKSQATISFVLPMSFKGKIDAYATDNALNSCEKVEPIGLIGETQSMHEETALAKVEVTSTSPKTEYYYTEDVGILYTLQDGYSGLNTVTYTAGSAGDTVEEYPDGEEIVTDIVTKSYTISVNSNNVNNIETGLMFIDNAGYEKTVDENDLPIIHIDTTAPVITVAYDNNDVLNETYYKDQRIATVSIKERNFDPLDTELIIDGPVVTISDWSHASGTGCGGSSSHLDTYHSDECVWSCTIIFSEDGDYTFTCNTTDLAGNYAEYEQIDEFTVDQTLPEISVTYDNDNVANELYYNASRTATVEIEEHNFESNEVEITMTATDDGQTIAIPSVSNWLTSGDTHTARIDYDYDGEFTFDIVYVDLAGNEAEDYTEDHFIVDLTEPVVTILDIEDMSANNGTVAPGVEVSDTNYSADDVVITFSGYNNGTVAFDNTRSSITNGQYIQFSDIPHVQDNDDLYTFVATAIDLAGNTYEEQVIFSVNRFGSVYILDEVTEGLVTDYYANEEKELHVTEINVDTLEFQEITYSKDGDVITLGENDNFVVEESGSDVSWKSYEYTIYADNFATEGSYIVTISSKDRALNQMNNKMTGKDIEFVIDKTSPSVVITGVEDGVQYNESSRLLTIDAKDNILLDKVYAYINGNDDVREFTSEDFSETNGIITIEIGDAFDWQTVRVVSADAAGNKAETDEIRFLITTNIFYQWYRNTVAFYGSLVGVVLIISGGGYLCYFYRRKQE